MAVLYTDYETRMCIHRPVHGGDWWGPLGPLGPLEPLGPMEPLGPIEPLGPLELGTTARAAGGCGYPMFNFSKTQDVAALRLIMLPDRCLSLQDSFLTDLPRKRDLNQSNRVQIAFSTVFREFVQCTRID